MRHLLRRFSNTAAQRYCTCRSPYIDAIPQYELIAIAFALKTRNHHVLGVQIRSTAFCQS